MLKDHLNKIFVTFFTFILIRVPCGNNVYLTFFFTFLIAEKVRQAITSCDCNISHTHSTWEGVSQESAKHFKNITFCMISFLFREYTNTPCRCRLLETTLPIVFISLNHVHGSAASSVQLGLSVSHCKNCFV